MDFPGIATPFLFALLWKLLGQGEYGFIAEEPLTFFITGCHVFWTNGLTMMSPNTPTPATMKKPRWKSGERTPFLFGHTFPWLVYF